MSTNLSSRASSLTTSFSEKKKIAYGYLPPAPPLWLQCFFLGVGSVFSMSLLPRKKTTFDWHEV